MSTPGLRERPAPTTPPTLWCTSPPEVPTWAAHGPVAARGRRLPRWLPVPVLVCAPLMAAEPLAAAAVFPVIGVAAGLVAAAVAVAIIWVAKGSTCGRDVAVAGLGWGATVAAGAALTVAAAVGAGRGVDDVTHLTVVGPVVEEAAKATFLVWAVWRAQAVTTALDGLVAAWWCATGFAFVENLRYFYDAELSGNLATVVVVRGVASPFAHLLFTAVVGVVAGHAASRCWAKRRSFAAVGAAVVAAAFIHGAWNRVAYTAATVELTGTDLAVVTAGVIGFVALFWVTVAAVAVTRDAEVARLSELTARTVAAHPSLAELGAGDVARYAALSVAEVDPSDEGERQRRLIGVLRDAHRRRAPRALRSRRGTTAANG